MIFSKYLFFWLALLLKPGVFVDKPQPSDP